MLCKNSKDEENNSNDVQKNKNKRGPLFLVIQDLKIFFFGGLKEKYFKIRMRFQCCSQIEYTRSAQKIPSQFILTKNRLPRVMAPWSSLKYSLYWSVPSKHSAKSSFRDHHQLMLYVLLNLVHAISTANFILGNVRGRSDSNLDCSWPVVGHKPR